MKTKNQKPKPKVYLTGFMGSGKSTAGPLVARRLGWRFLDLDDVIAERAGRSIPELFEDGGEKDFRRREAEALRRVSEEAGEAVVATGGGALVPEENRRRARQSGLVVYLRAPARVLAERLAREAAERPLLQDEDGKPLAGAALTRRIERLLSERRRFYEQAPLAVDTADASPEETAAIIAEVVHAGDLT